MQEYREKLSELESLVQTQENVNQQIQYVQNWLSSNVNKFEHLENNPNLIMCEKEFEGLCSMIQMMESRLQVNFLMTVKDPKPKTFKALIYLARVQSTQSLEYVEKKVQDLQSKYEMARISAILVFQPNFDITKTKLTSVIAFTEERDIDNKILFKDYKPNTEKIQTQPRISEKRKENEQLTPQQIIEIYKKIGEVGYDDYTIKNMFNKEERRKHIDDMKKFKETIERHVVEMKNVIQATEIKVCKMMDISYEIFKKSVLTDTKWLDDAVENMNAIISKAFLGKVLTKETFMIALQAQNKIIGEEIAKISEYRIYCVEKKNPDLAIHILRFRINDKLYMDKKFEKEDVDESRENYQNDKEISALLSQQDELLTKFLAYYSV